MRYRVLIVDDEEVVRDLGKRSLERQGHQVLVAADGPAAGQHRLPRRVNLK